MRFSHSSFRILWLLLIGIALVGCNLDSSTPPGVEKEDITEVPKKPNFNAHIRPLLWKLSHQSNSTHANQWQNYSERGLAFKPFKEAIKSEGLPYGVKNAKDLTLLWRWSKSGGEIDHPEWLISPLPKKRSENSSALNELL